MNVTTEITTATDLPRVITPMDHFFVRVKMDGKVMGSNALTSMNVLLATTTVLSTTTVSILMEVITVLACLDIGRDRKHGPWFPRPLKRTFIDPLF